MWRLDFEINLIFLIEPFSYMTKKWKKKSKYLENKKSFKGEIKSIFHLFERAFRCQKLSQTLECAFNIFSFLHLIAELWMGVHPNISKQQCHDKLEECFCRRKVPKDLVGKKTKEEKRDKFSNLLRNFVFVCLFVCFVLFFFFLKNFTVRSSRIPLFDLTLELLERIQIFTFAWNLIPQKTSFEA